MKHLSERSIDLTAEAMIAARRSREEDRRQMPRDHKIIEPLVDLLKSHPIAAVITMPEIGKTPDQASQRITQLLAKHRPQSKIVKINPETLQGRRSPSSKEIEWTLKAIADGTHTYVVSGFRYGILPSAEHTGSPEIREALQKITRQKEVDTYTGRLILIGQSSSDIRGNFSSISVPQSPENAGHFAHEVPHSGFLTYFGADREHALRSVGLLQHRLAKRANAINGPELLPQIDVARLAGLVKP